MQKLRHLLRDALTARAALIALLALIACAVATATEAQSGRRPPKRSEPPPTSAPETAPPDQPNESKPAKESLKIHIVKDQSSGFNSPGMVEYVADSCAAYIRKHSSAGVTVGREMNRKQASDQAKGSADLYVVWLDLHYDSFNQRNDPRDSRYRDNFVVEYTVFAPGTGKNKTHGRVYSRESRGRVGGTGIPLPVPGTGSAGSLDYTLRLTGEEIGERVISALKLDIPIPR